MTSNASKEQAPSAEQLKAFNEWQASQASKKGKTVGKRTAMTVLKARYKSEYDVLVKHCTESDISDAKLVPASVK